MGYDISYHPISKAQINNWYSDILENINLSDNLKVKVPSEQLKDESQRDEFEEFYLDKYKDTIMWAKEAQDDFSKVHAYAIAVVQGFFEEFFYTRGSALSFIKDDSFFDKYITSWKDIAPAKYLDNFKYDMLNENYSGGVYISAKQVELLLKDYEDEIAIKTMLDEHFSHKRIEVFLDALNFAKEKGVGILEASEVVEPHPDFNEEPACYCNLFNCDPKGITLFQMACMEQIQERHTV